MTEDLPGAPELHHEADALWLEGVALEMIAERVGTPIYVYSAGAMRRRARALLDAFAGQRCLPCYAVKANHHLAVIRLFAGLGLGADTVSQGEIERALAAGVPPERIVFAGVAKTDDELRFALALGIRQINVESVDELRRIAAIAAELGTRAPIAFRVNPDVAAGGHSKISTGKKGDKFGIPWDDAVAVYREAAALAAVEPVGLHLHIGSQITDLAPFELAFTRAVDLLRAIRASGVPLARLDLGGGLGVRYRDEPVVAVADYAALVARLTRGLDCEILLEPGRSLVAEAGVLLARTIYEKVAGGRRFAILDTGMNVLMRPALYDAWHEILPVRRRGPLAEVVATDVVGPICESTDMLARGRPLPPLAPGDLVAFATAGAYGAVMASGYNTRPSAAEVLVDGGRWAVITARRSAQEQFASDRIPAWLDETDRVTATEEAA